VILQGEKQGMYCLSQTAQEAFIHACRNPDQRLLELLLLHPSSRPTGFVNVHSTWSEGGQTTTGFVEACKFGACKVNLLLRLRGRRRIDVHWGSDAALCAACKDFQACVVLRLLRLDGDRRMDLTTNLGEKLFVSGCESVGGHVIVKAILPRVSAAAVRKGIAAATAAGGTERMRLVRHILQHCGQKRLPSSEEL